MSRRKKWFSTDLNILMDNYETKSIMELMELLPSRSQDSINSKIKRLKADKKINTEKSKEAITRAYKQRIS